MGIGLLKRLSDSHQPCFDGEKRDRNYFTAIYNTFVSQRYIPIISANDESAFEYPQVKHRDECILTESLLSICFILINLFLNFVHGLVKYSKYALFLFLILQNPTIWKTLSFKSLVNQHFNPKRNRSDTDFCIISVGDSMCEYIASDEVKKMLCSINQMNRSNNEVLLHRIKLKQNPTIHEMLKQNESMINEVDTLKIAKKSITIQSTHHNHSYIWHGHMTNEVSTRCLESGALHRVNTKKCGHHYVVANVKSLSIISYGWSAAVFPPGRDLICFVIMSNLFTMITGGFSF